MSWGAAKRAVKKFGADNTVLLFTDTRIESPDLYAFLWASAVNTGARLIEIADGRTPFEVFRDVGMLGNSRVDPCSRVLKREIAQRWLNANCDPLDTTLVFGLDYTEGHRFNDGDGRGVLPRYAKLGWHHVEAPMMAAPYLGRREMMTWAKLEGLPVSSAYETGFAHDNCGGGCVKAGKGHFSHLLKMRPDVYARWEAEEDAFNNARLDKLRQTILRDEITGQPTKPLSLRQLRERIEREPEQIDLFDIGGCGCFVTEGEDDVTNE